MRDGIKPKHVQAVIVVLMVAFSIMSYFDRTIISVAGPSLAKEFKLSETQMGTIYSAFILSYAVLMIPGGRVADRFGPRIALTLMGFGAGLFTCLTALGGRPGIGAWIGIFPAFLVVRFGLGAATAPLYPSCAKMSGNWVMPVERAQVWGLVASGAGIGSSLTPFIATWLIAHCGWQQLFCQAGILTVLLAALWFWYARDYPWEHASISPAEGRLLAAKSGSEDPVPPGSAPWRQLLTDCNLILLTLSYSAVAYFEYIFFFWIYYYLGSVRHLRASETSGYTTIIFISWTVMTPFGGWISDRLSHRFGRKAGRRAVTVTGLTLAAVFLFLGTRLGGAVTTGALLALSLGFASTTEGPFWSSAIDLGRVDAGAASGILNTGSNLGGFVAPILTPLLASSVGWTFALQFGCLVVVLGLLIWFFIDPTGGINHRQEPQKPAGHAV